MAKVSWVLGSFCKAGGLGALVSRRGGGPDALWRSPQALPLACGPFSMHHEGLCGGSRTQEVPSTSPAHADWPPPHPPGASPREPMVSRLPEQGRVTTCCVHVCSLLDGQCNPPVSQMGPFPEGPGGSAAVAQWALPCRLLLRHQGGDAAGHRCRRLHRARRVLGEPVWDQVGHCRCPLPPRGSPFGWT